LLTLTRSISFIILSAFFLLGAAPYSYAGDSTGVIYGTAVRLQLQSLADEVVDSAGLDDRQPVIISVDGNGPLILAENAFIETLQRKKFQVLLNKSSASEQRLQIFLLDVNVAAQRIDSNLSARKTSVILEARTDTGSVHLVRMIGKFQRESIDTLDILPPARQLMQKNDEENGIMKKLLTPVIVIGSAALIVYLLFTVRS